MAQFQYKVVPFIGKVTSKQGANDVAKQLQNLINHHAEKGWEFHAISDVNIEVQPGCLAALFGASSQYIRFDQVVFRAPRGG